MGFVRKEFKRHNGLIHSDKATKKQRKEARKVRTDKLINCGRCGARILKKNRVRNLRACDGEEEYVVSETRQRNTAKRGRKTKN